MSDDRDGKLLTVAEAKRHLDLGEDGDDYDDVVADLIEAAEADFELYTGLRIVAQAETRYFDGDVKRFVLPFWPVKPDSVTIVDTYGTTATTDDETYSSDYYRVDEERGIIHRTSSIGVPKFWGAGVRRWKVTWTGGINQRWDWASLRVSLKGTIRDLVVDRFTNHNPRATEERDGGGVGRSLERGALPSRVREKWDELKRVY